MTKEERLIDLLIYALLPKRIYNHELDMSTMNKFRNIIQESLRDDTYTIRAKLVDCWDNIGKENKNQKVIFDYMKDEVQNEKYM